MTREPRQQMEDYAFSLEGHAYHLEEVYTQRPVPSFVTAKKPSSIPWKTCLETIGTNVCPATFHTNTESVPADVQRNEADYIIVGVVLVDSANNEELQSPQRKSPSTGQNHLGDAIQAVAERLKSASRSTHEEAKAVEAMQGNRTGTLTLDEMYKKLAHAVDAGEIRSLKPKY